jgi:ParB family chromosome partitioning protein
MSSKFQNDAIFWVEVEKIKPNPYQPRRDFNEERLRDLAESIRQYGVLQPLTVTRREHVKDDGGLKVEYELIAGERRHRASQLANLSQVPVIIRSGEENSQVKLELAIIENLQREDLNPFERAEAFDQLAAEFEFTHKEIAKKVGKSREYVSNSMRLLKLPEDIKQAIINGQMTEGHARPIMMLRDKPQEQETLFKEVVHKGLTVREAESIARRDAQDKVRKKKNKINPETKQLEDRLSDTFGTRVKIEERDVGGKLVIDFFSDEDLENIIKLVKAGGNLEVGDMMEQYVESIESADNREEVDNVSKDNSGEKTEDFPEGTSMAETLGTMIAAARKQNAVKEEKNEEERNGGTSGQDTRETDQSSDDAEQINESDFSNEFEQSQTDELYTEPSTSETHLHKTLDNSVSTEGDVMPEDELMHTEVKQEVSGDLPTDEENDDEKIDTSSHTIEKDEISVAVSSDESNAQDEHDEETEEDETDEEIYSVSNFSI